MASITYDVQKQIKAIEKTPPIHTFLYDTFVQNEGAVLAEALTGTTARTVWRWRLL